ncbi:hypothetical protein E6P09_07280 [Haloferax mediterranei ATCC 33500]|uniref:Uncharacterized protein n=1 Tax=Haloferax mediterranei (strain ATCC 33500 / DSM 1411 / JCM 8866 / NBRC 14739 / NCIMB 2177 / R-4) TaxID=523841 RepID=I3R2W2_HALMT|nr:hypothetical protein [Haloferax mediterranei]AFK18572.1 hypothetical protein HFX_0851 [Haloferax mediterranei ATCC 33500]AHZ22052.1 hypothetical protein BM92_04980 [Haloferax mediterranei ATCC 33500]EMA02152.1 hypothetical protein C439_06215 [Haloferax mediterranei ATCC 33500]MDX5988661.1 hypothetical protein [Haloferax mediterranei ATCC 33500]QCQ75073.1 hypothetical protein E6P09_07280 [Haloferax mediterranei ATCC 33500]
MDTAVRLFPTLLFVLIIATAPVTAATGPTSPCFHGEGHQFDIGGEGAGIDLVVFLSMFENLGGAGGFGMEASGDIGNQSIIQLRAGVAFDGVGPVTDFLSNPFSRFSVVYDYSMNLPMFADSGLDSSYNADGSPVSGIRTKQC